MLVESAFRFSRTGCPEDPARTGEDGIALPNLGGAALVSEISNDGGRYHLAR